MRTTTRNLIISLACTITVCCLLSSLGGAQDGEGNTPETSVTTSAQPAPTPEASKTPKAHDDSFVIGNDDVLAVNVWKEPEV